jgi:hypothetical protein
MKSLVLNLLLFAIVVVAALELIFRTLIPASNIAYKTLDKQYGILLHDTTGDREGVSTTGRLIMQRVHWRINNCGWRSDKDYYPPSPSRKPVIALIGDSYVAGFQVNYENHFGALLEERLNHGYDVYNFGSGGVPAAQYMYVAKYAHDRFDPDLYVFLVRDPTWMNSISNYARDLKVRQIRWKSDHFEEILPQFASGTISRLRKRSALVRYLVYNANVDLIGGITDATHRVTPPPTKEQPKTFLTVYPLVHPAMEYLLDELRASVGDKPVLFLANVNIENVYDDLPRQSQETLPWLKDACSSRGMNVLDLAPAFAADWKAQHRPLTFAIDYHWNEHGHQVVCDAVLDYITRTHLLERSCADSAMAQPLTEHQ